MGLLESVLGALGGLGAKAKMGEPGEPGQAEETPTEEALSQGQVQRQVQPGGLGLKLIGLVAELIEQHGGVQGLMQRFDSKGLGQVFASWVGTQPNQEIDPDQVQHAVGHDQLAELAQKFGIDPGKASEMLSQYLPKIVDRLTPSGQIEPRRDVAGFLAGLLKGDPDKQL